MELTPEALPVGSMTKGIVDVWSVCSFGCLS